MYRKAFRRRLKQIRQDAGYTQAEFARALDVPEKTYAKYESRSLLPTYLIPRICELTGHHAWFVLTGQSPESQPVRPKPLASVLKLAPRRRQ